MSAAAATAEVPRSSSGGGGGGGSVDSYIGSVISLISKSEIRYEGVLYNIDTQESTIGLRNVRSFGTEGRKKDGLQVPPSDKIYEFILFRGRDIKDLQVKSSPPAQNVQTDPPIIQSHYPRAAATTMSVSLGATGSLTDVSSHTSPIGMPSSTFQGSLPPYQSGVNLGSWDSSTPPATNVNGLAMPTYWQGYHGPSNEFQAQQQTLLQPPLGISKTFMQQSMQYPAMNVSNFSASHLSDNPSPFLPPLHPGTQTLQSFIPSVPFSAIVSESANSVFDKASIPVLSTTSLSGGNLPLASPLTTALDKSATMSLDSEMPMTVPGPIIPSTSASEPVSFITGTSSSLLNEEAKPSLVTPGQFLQLGIPAVPSLQSSQTSQKDVEVVEILAPESPSPPSTSAVAGQEPIIPLPSKPEHKAYGATLHSYDGSRGCVKGTGNEISCSATRFTEDFDFTAMNEKFNKDEVWGHLGKSNKAQQDVGYSQDKDNTELSKPEPVYVKDDFFDNLSCNALDARSRNGRTRFSEQFRRDTETFGDSFRHHSGWRGWGPGRGAQSYGNYHMRRYGYGGRGRGYNMSSHAI